MLREQILSLLQQGKTYNEIVQIVGCCKATISYHAQKSASSKTLPFRRYDWQEIQAFHDQGNNYTACRRQFGFAKDTWDRAIARGELSPRDFRIPLDVLLVEGRRTERGHLKQRLIAVGVLENRCAECGLTQWRGKPLSLDLHHN